MVVFYDLDSHAYEATSAEVLTLPVGRRTFADPGDSLTSSPTADNYLADPVVCHCLNVRASQIARTIEATGARSLCELACSTGAGTGCTACHRRLRQFFAGRPTPRAEQPAASET